MYSHQRTAAAQRRQGRRPGPPRAGHGQPPSRAAEGHDARPELLVGHLAELRALTRGLAAATGAEPADPLLAEQVDELTGAERDIAGEIRRLRDRYRVADPGERPAPGAVGNGRFLRDRLAEIHVRAVRTAQRALLIAAALGEANTAVLLGMRMLAHQRHAGRLSSPPGDVPQVTAARPA
ncbi:hypothetical protein GCM10012275_49360 [Longimycelium tulufanense]|uniref:Uncharacterized protein n=1 Tax=Longimycelium tulufanense TaxID=907463 RepID=A0A8J3CGM7_9PSEU|nr:hypothetical protein [Longimycelium tulufanense]GGM72856.1 hypothetical protein GCM10012275_49360 [Longimycelium tulufanense]